MNKKELRKAIIELPVDCSGLRPKIDQLTTLELVKLLDEPEKVVVPQFVADWYEEYKDDFEYSVWEHLINIDKKQKYKFYLWMNNVNNNPLQTLVNMHQFGYEVKKEPKYTVKMKNNKFSSIRLLSFGEISGEWFFTESGYGNVITKFTRKQLEEAGFGWVFDCPGIEIEEVTE